MFRMIFSFVQSIAVAISLLAYSGAWVGVGGYLRQLDRMNIYDNRARNSIAQTVVYDIVLDHFMQPRDNGRVPKGIIIVYDGARADTLINTVDYEHSAIFRLQREGGGIYHMFTGGRFPLFQDTSTGASFATLLTGRWARGPGGHRVLSNSCTKPLDPNLIFNTLLNRSEHVTGAAFVVSWDGHFARTDAEGRGIANYSLDVAYAQQRGFTDANDISQGAMQWSMNGSDAESIAVTMGMLEDLNGPDFIVLSLEYCDIAGHGGGFGNHNPGFIEAFRASERAAYAMIDAIEARATYEDEDWLILITSDHGGMNYYHGAQWEVIRQVFLVSNKDLGFGR